jgi:uncharacterized protein YbjT (DUF2867 family)
MTTTTNHSLNTPERVLVIGGSGKTGRRVCARLAARGVETRAVSRSSRIPFDWTDPDSWAAALPGVDAIYLTYSPDLAIPGARERVERFLALAAGHGVRRIVLLSGRGEAEAQACERVLQGMDLDWTVVRASWFMQNFSEGEFLPMVLAGELALPARDIPEPFIDIDDIADVVTAALTEAGHAHEVYEVTGPRALTFAETAAGLSNAIGRPVTFTRLSPAAFADGLAAAGLPEDIAWLLNYLFDTVLDGRNTRVTDDVERALGRPANDFASFLRARVAEGAWGRPGERVA